MPVDDRRPALLIPVALSALVGTLLGLLVESPPMWWPLAGLGATLFVLIAGRSGRPVSCCLIVLLTGAALAGWRRAHDTAMTQVLEPMVPRLVVIRVRVGHWPQGRAEWIQGLGAINADVRLSGVRLPSGTTLTGLGTLVAGRQGLVRARMSTDCSIDPPPERGWLTTTMRTLRNGAADRLADHPGLRGSAQALVEASVLGKRGAAFRRLYQPFLTTGTAHLLAVSGLHLALLAGLGLGLRRVLAAPAWWDAIVLACTAITMLLLVDVRPPLARSAVMALVLAAGPLLYRRLAGGAALCAALLVALVFDPTIVLRPGPQLSFTVVAALVWVLPAVEARAKRSLRPTGPWWRAWRAGWVAWAISTPIIMAHFGRAGPLAVPAAMAMVPVLTVLLAAGWVRVLVPPGVLDTVTGWVLEVSAGVLLWSVEVLALLPGATLTGPRMPLWWVLAAEACVVWLCLRPGRWAWAATLSCPLVATCF